MGIEVETRIIPEPEVIPEPVVDPEKKVGKPPEDDHRSCAQCGGIMYRPDPDGCFLCGKCHYSEC